MARTSKSASDYVREYHGLVVNDARQGLFATAHITQYQVRSGDELGKLLAALKAVLGLKSRVSTSGNYGTFYFANDKVMDPFEPFYWQGIRRSFGFKASPAEMRDTLRLAYRCGRIAKAGTKDAAKQAPAAATPEAYAHTFFGLDCNGLVGNYFGLSPEVNIQSWASISAKGEKQVHKKVEGDGHHKGIADWNGWVRAAVQTLDYIPLTPRKKASEAKTGDILIDVNTAGEFKHIAIVDDVTPVDEQTVNWRVVEWGSETSEASIGTGDDKHIKQKFNHTLTTGPRKDFGLGHLNGKKSRFRYLFAGPDVPFPPAAHGRCGKEEI